MALLLGACSGNPPATSSGGTGTGGTGTTPDGNGDSNGDGDGDGGGDGGSTELQAANTAFEAARDAVAAATAAATLAATADTEAARADARTKIAAARTALAAAVTAANAAHAAAEAGDDDTALGAAIQLRDRVTAYQTAELAKLSTAEAPLFWFTRALVRQAIADGEVQVPKENTNTATIVRTARTKDTSATSTVQIENTAPVPIKSTTFKLVPYASGKMVFSSDATHSGEETFKVDGYTNWLASNEAAQDSDTTTADSRTYTGLQLTGSGLVVRFGGKSGNYADTQIKLGTDVDYSGTDQGANGWDLAITFDDPQTFSGAKGVRSWQGNGDFYWKARVRPHASQLSGGANFVANELNQPKGYENLGVYEVWLSNHIGIDKRLEPVSGSNAPANPDDDVHLYLKYAAYGLFLFTADDGLAFAGYNQRKGRVQTIDFGYTAFEDATGKKTTDINKPITGGTFTGQTIAVAYRGDASDATPVAPPYPRVESKLLRGVVSLTVSIPKSTGSGTLSGTINGFETWDPSNNRWTTGLTLQNPTMTAATGVATITAFHLNTTGVATGGTAVTIDDDGTFSGIAKAAGTNLDNALNNHDGGSNDAGGVFKGNFYGPRTDTALEIAGSWRSRPHAGGELDNDKWQISGSFGAKQQQPASSQGFRS